MANLLRFPVTVFADYKDRGVALAIGGNDPHVGRDHPRVLLTEHDGSPSCYLLGRKILLNTLNCLEDNPKRLEVFSLPVELISALPVEKKIQSILHDALECYWVFHC